MKNIKEILKKIFLFKNIDDNVVERCCEINGYEIKDYSPQDILQDYKTAPSIGILLNGKANIISGDEGVIIRKLIKTDLYGVAKLFDTPKYSTKVIATTKCSVLILKKQFVEECISIDNKIAFNYIEFLSQKIGFLNDKISSYTAKTADNKLYTYILQLPRNNNTVILNTDFSAIAKMLGIGRASLYRAFAKLENDGLIIKNNKEIILKEV